MKFGHIADCHIGGWRDEKLSKLGIDSFEYAINKCIEENVGFVLIAGDLFDTALPSIDYIREVAHILAKLKEVDVDCYCIPGSHDFSPTGKTMLDVLEKAGLLLLVNKYENEKLKIFEDKTGVKIAGLLGRRGGLERLDYEKLDKEHLENEEGFKIFMFHNALEEFKPVDLAKVECMGYGLMPRNFTYYAGGHVHYRFDVQKEGYGWIVYPGPTFPNNFKELEELKFGSFCIVDDQLNITRKFIKLKEVIDFKIEGSTSNEINDKLKGLLVNDLEDKIILLRVRGLLEEGKIGDIKFKEVIKEIEDKGAFAILKNTNGLKVKEFDDIDIKGDVDNVEEEVLKEFSDELIKPLMGVFNDEKKEGETNVVYEERLIKEVLKELGLEETYAS